MDDTIRRILDEQNQLAKLADPYREIDRIVGRTATDLIRSTYSDLTANDAALTALQYAEEERKRLTDMVSQVDEYVRLATNIDAMTAVRDSTQLVTDQFGLKGHYYDLPAYEQLTELANIINGPTAASLISHYRDQPSAVQLAMEAIQAPWVNSNDSLQSVLGFTSLHGIGATLAFHDPFNDRVAEILRQDLGDWRAEIEWPESIFTNALARNAFYIEQGFNPDLVRFPSESFHEVLHHARLRPIASGEPVVTGDENNAELGAEDFQRTNEAHATLLYFETRLRQFIALKLGNHYGEGWMKQQVPGDIRKSCQERREEAREQGREAMPEIHYADFLDYIKIITRKDNWEAVFKAHFKRPELVTESFQRLKPIRNDTMHGRFITPTDELYLLAETTRILDAIDLF